MHIISWSTALYEGWRAAEQALTSQSKQSFSRVIVIGMGGSGIAGQLLALISRRFRGVPVEVVDSPEVPHTIDATTLCIVCSYSGNTWETCAAFDALASFECTVIALASGGRLAAAAVARGVPLVALPAGHVPRNVLPWFLGGLMAVMDRYGLITQMQSVVRRISAHWDMVGAATYEKNTAAPFLSALKNEPFCHVWGVRGDTDAAAYRAQTQLNENSKMASVYSCFPELNHNLLVGFTSVAQYPPILFLATDFCIPSLRCAIESLFEVLASRRIPLYKPVLFGDTWEEQVAYSLWWSDSASYHIGCERGHAIQATVLIDQLKQTFSKKAVKHEEEPSS